MGYGWIIDTDHIDDGKSVGAKGTTGPRDAPEELISILERGTAPTSSAIGSFGMYRFQMYDDDGELYYTGRMITDEGDTEDACYAPLGDYGTPAAGATEIRYPRHRHMDCG